jgi:hypothetical protein
VSRSEIVLSVVMSRHSAITEGSSALLRHLCLTTSPARISGYGAPGGRPGPFPRARAGGWSPGLFAVGAGPGVDLVVGSGVGAGAQRVRRNAGLRSRGDGAGLGLDRAADRGRGAALQALGGTGRSGDERAGGVVLQPGEPLRSSVWSWPQKSAAELPRPPPQALIWLPYRPQPARAWPCASSGW